MQKFVIFICLLPLFACKARDQDGAAVKAGRSSPASTVKPDDVIAVLQQSISKAGGRLYPRSISIELPPDDLDFKKCYLALDGDALFLRCGPSDTLFCYLNNLRADGQVKVKGNLAGIDCTVLLFRKPGLDGKMVQDKGTRRTSFVVNLDKKSLTQISSQRKAMDEKVYFTSIFLSWVDDDAVGIQDNLNPLL